MSEGFDCPAPPKMERCPKCGLMIHYRWLDQTATFNPTGLCAWCLEKEAKKC